MNSAEKCQDMCRLIRLSFIRRSPLSIGFTKSKFFIGLCNPFLPTTHLLSILRNTSPAQHYSK